MERRVYQDYVPPITDQTDPDWEQDDGIDTGLDDIFNRRKKKKQKEIDNIEKWNALTSEMKRVLSTRSGREIIYWIIGSGNLLMDIGKGRSLETEKLAGRQTLALEVMQLALRADHQFFSQYIDSKLHPKVLKPLTPQGETS